MVNNKSLYEHFVDSIKKLIYLSVEDIFFCILHNVLCGLLSHFAINIRESLECRLSVNMTNN